MLTTFKPEVIGNRLSVYHEPKENEAGDAIGLWTLDDSFSSDSDVENGWYVGRVPFQVPEDTGQLRVTISGFGLYFRFYLGSLSFRLSLVQSTTVRTREAT